MDLLYSTDLHGHPQRYKRLLDFAIEQKINLIHLGADLLPKGMDLVLQQERFIKNDLQAFYGACKKEGITVLAFFGNDDIYLLKPTFRKYCGKLLDETPYAQDGYEFKAYGFVPDYPFTMKAACKLDSPGWKIPESYYGDPVEVRKKHSHLEFYDIPDIDKYFNSKGTIQEDLNKIKVTNKTIMAIHSPPSGVGLDICRDRRAVGSQAVYNFIKKTNAAVVLAGHIHESPDMTGLWNIKIGKTVVVQPGQKEDSLTVVIIKILGNEVELERHHLEIY